MDCARSASESRGGLGGSGVRWQPSPAIAANRHFYDALWAASGLIQPHRFNTWPLLSTLAANSPTRLEVGPGLRPRLPIDGTWFVDLSQAALPSLRREGGMATHASATALPFPDRSFDMICAFDVVEHVEDDRQVLREITRVAKDGAAIVLSVPLHPAQWSSFDALVGHVRRYDPGDLAVFLREHCLDVEQSAAFGMQPRSRRLLDLAVWGLTHRRDQAMRWYNRVFLPFGLLTQKRLIWMDGLVVGTNVDEIVLVCRRTARAAEHGTAGSDAAPENRP